MKDNKLSEAIKNIIEKELKTFSRLLPKDTLINATEKLMPQIENLIEQSGYVKKSKYQILKRIIDDLEKRISDLEKDQS
tara:strand:- start:1346 stop:1582 length:237 start_codon:yes stop_codon:yes gene_type:complete